MWCTRREWLFITKRQRNVAQYKHLIVEASNKTQQELSYRKQIPRHEDHICLFCSFCQLRGIRRSVPRTVFQLLVSCLVLPRLDYCNAVLAGISLHLARCLQSVMNAAARLVFTSSKCDHITLLLRQLHLLKVPRRIYYKLVVLVYKCLHGLAPSYLADKLHHPAESQFLKASAFRFVSWTVYSPYPTLNLYSDQAFPVAAVRIWNSLPQHITSAPSLPVFCSCLKTYFFKLCYTRNYWCRAREVILSFVDKLIALTYLLTYYRAGCSTTEPDPCPIGGINRFFKKSSVYLELKRIKDRQTKSLVSNKCDELTDETIYRAIALSNQGRRLGGQRGTVPNELEVGVEMLYPPQYFVNIVINFHTLYTVFRRRKLNMPLHSPVYNKL